MYRIEIFDEKMDFVSACYTDDAQTIAIDYLAYDPFQITTQVIEAKKGYFAHITGRNNELVADCIIADVQPDKEQQELSLRPLQALFDVGVFYSPVSDAITWIGNNLTDQFVTNADTLQNRPLNITATAGSRSFPLTGYNLNPTINILSVITNAFATWGIVTEAYLDLSEKEIVVNIYEQVAQQTIECDLDNIISAEITLGDSYGSTNKLTIRKTVEEGTPTGTTEITYFRHTDGSINTTDDDRIVPVFWEVATIEQTSDMTDAQWIQETFTKAKEVLSVGHYDNEVILSVWEDDKIINPKSIEIGTIVTLLLKGETYYSILTGYQVEGSIYTLTFGAVRTELTKKLSIQNRGSSSSSSSSGGGGGGGGGGAVTGVKGNEEILYRVGDVNLTPADIGSVPTTTTINGHALSTNVTITKADVGLGNVDNTSDANKPISTATQTALDTKVDKVTGMGLSSNDFTDALLTKLNGIESGAQRNTVTGVKGSRESTYRTGNINITADQVGAAHGVNEILNPFAPEYDYRIQLDRTDNAFYFADRRWTVTGEKTDSSDVVTSLSTYQVGQLFDMGEANTLNVPQGGKLVITMDFTGSSGTDVFPNYPYGFVYLDFYYNAGCASVTARVYGKHTGTESYWRDLTVTADSRNTAYHIRYIVNQTVMYNMQKLEFTINGLSNMTGSLSEISYYMTRANKDRDMPYVSKLRAETLYYNLTAPKFVGALQGNADTATKATQDGSGNNIVNTYATQTALNAKVNKTDIATTSNLGLVKPDGSSITIDADGTIHSVGGGGGGSSSPSRVLLWTNPSTSTPFPAQNVLSASQISAYTSFEIEVRNYIAENIYNICKITKDSPRQVWAFDTSTMGANSGVPAITNRQVVIDSNGLSFAIGYSKTTTNSGRAGSTPDVCIPCRIWGIVDSGGTSSITYFESQTTSVASNAEILRITDSSITTNTIVLECTFANPSAIRGDVSWTSYNGYIAFTGTCTSATTANVTLADKTN